MLVFKILTDENRDEMLDFLSENITDIDKDYTEEILDSLLCDEDSEYAVSSAYGCVMVRVFDGRYSFIYPIELCDDANATLAAASLREYVLKEEIPLIYTDVPRESLGGLLPLFRHANIDAADKSAESYTVSVLTEASMLDEVPRMYIDDITLDSLRAADDSEYARLCRDEETNRYWGYDYREDNPDPDDSYFRENAEREFARGVSISFAIRFLDDFVGEALLYRFDYLGGCDVAIRILPEYRKRGIAGQVLERLQEFAADTGLCQMYSSVNINNIASVKLCQPHFDSETNDGKTVRFSVDL